MARHSSLTTKEIALEAMRVDGIDFFSATYRLFKLDDLEPECEDYGQAVVYLGTVEGEERVFTLDKHHQIERGRIFPICGNSWKMLSDTRFAEHFQFIGDFSTHYGVFAGCGGGLALSGCGKVILSGSTVLGSCAASASVPSPP